MEIGQKKVKADEIPAQAHRLYIKLYCERKGEKNKKTIREAKNSWISLSLSEKKLFCKTSVDGMLLKYAHGLCSTETFLKEKKSRKLNKSCNIEDSHEKLEPHATIININESNLTENESHLSVETELIVDDNRNNTNSEEPNVNEIISNDIDQEAGFGSTFCDTGPSNGTISETNLVNSLEAPSNADSNQEGTAVLLVEPAPPTVMFGKDLYEKIKDPDGENWRELSESEKRQYNAAVRAVKKEYIKNYTAYLESLSQQQLFDHYIKTVK